MSCTWLTKKEVAEWLRIDKTTVTRWIKAGKLPAIRQGQIIRICAGDVERMMGMKGGEQG